MSGLRVTVTENQGFTGPSASGIAGILVIPGAEGPPGVAGVTGPRGIDGPTGPIGPTGLQGVAGPTGPQGPTGALGPTGPLSFAHAYGEMSSAGVTGTISSGSWVKLLWTVEGLYSNVVPDVVSDYNFTVSEAGLYLCDLHLQLTESITLHEFEVAIFKNGVQQVPSTAVINLVATSRSEGGNGSVLIRCNVGDVIDSRIISVGGSGSSVGGMNLSADYGSFRVIKIAP